MHELPLPSGFKMSIKLSKCKANDHKFLFFIFVVINQLINFIVGPSTCQKVNNEREDVFKGKNSVIDQKNCRFKNGFCKVDALKYPHMLDHLILYTIWYPAQAPMALHVPP